MGVKMTFAYAGDGSLDYFPCRYGRSKLLFRGPGQQVKGDYVAVLGGTETYGKFVPAPYPALIGGAGPVINLGGVNTGPDAWLNDPAVLDLIAGARATVVQMTPAQNLSNRFYTVHPRRNDRFVAASPLLRSVYPAVDFTEFAFTGHLMRALRAAAADRFQIVLAEVQAAWAARMASLLRMVGGRKILLWMGATAPAAAATDPMLITAPMVTRLAQLADHCLIATPSPQAVAQGTGGMIYPVTEQAAAAALPNPLFHAEVAAALTEWLQ